MPKNGNYQEYFQKAGKYDLLAAYYKYLDPNKHIAYYQKHIQYMNLAMQTMRTNTGQLNQVSLQPAKVRVIHASPDTGNVDIYINGTKVLKDFPYKEVSNYVPLPAGKYQIDIYPAGNMVSTVLSRKVTVEAGKLYSLTTAGNADKLKLLTVEDQPAVPSGETKVRFIHLSPDAPAFDIAVKNRDVIFPDLSFRKFTSYLVLSPMTVDLEARIAGTPNVSLPMPRMQFKENQIYTILIVGSVTGEPELETMSIMG